MELLSNFVSFILHIDVHLFELASQYGLWLYAILFVIVFCETDLLSLPSFALLQLLTDAEDHIDSRLECVHRLVSDQLEDSMLLNCKYDIYMQKYYCASQTKWKIMC